MNSQARGCAICSIRRAGRKRFHSAPVASTFRRRRGGLVADRRHVGRLAFLGLVRHAEHLARPDAVGIADLLLVGEIDRRIADAVAVDAARNAPQRIAAADDDGALHLLQLRRSRLGRRRCRASAPAAGGSAAATTGGASAAAARFDCRGSRFCRWRLGYSNRRRRLGRLRRFDGRSGGLGRRRLGAAAAGGVSAARLRAVRCRRRRSAAAAAGGVGSRRGDTAGSAGGSCGAAGDRQAGRPAATRRARRRPQRRFGLRRGGSAGGAGCAAAAPATVAGGSAAASAGGATAAIASPGSRSNGTAARAITLMPSASSTSARMM